MFTGVLGQDISIGEKYSSHAFAKANRLANILHKTVIRADWRGSSVAGAQRKVLKFHAFRCVTHIALNGLNPVSKKKMC